MKYQSTRDPSLSATFEEALCRGYAPDGGLFVPQHLPELNLHAPSTLAHLATLTYPQLAYTLLRPFIDPLEVPEADLQDICQKSYQGFPDPDHAVPVVPLWMKKNSMTASQNPRGEDPQLLCYMAELFHGPTFCFKDLGMRAVIHLLHYMARKRQQRLCLLVSTTGDTGPAAAQAVADLASTTTAAAPGRTLADPAWLTLLVHYPQGQISELQRRQMTTLHSNRTVQVVAFEGGGDDMDRPIKNLLAENHQKHHQPSNDDATATKNVILTGVNSYNIGRPLMQMVHYVWIYLRVMEQCQKPYGDPEVKLEVMLPTGAMGNLTGGYLAKKMGLPLGRLWAGVNVNDVTDRVVRTGSLTKRFDEAMTKTLSDAINIQVPYNLERILFYLTHGDHDQIRTWYQQLERPRRTKQPQDGVENVNDDDDDQQQQEEDAVRGFELGPHWWKQLQTEFGSARVTDDQMCQTMRDVYHQCDYLADPHTAVALCAAQQVGALPSLPPPPSSGAAASDTTGQASATSYSPAFLKQQEQPQVHPATPPPLLVVLATAAPCKFREAVEAAFGTADAEHPEENDDDDQHGSVWARYWNSPACPAGAHDLYDRPEQAPVIYRAHPDRTLEENQQDWEQRARQLIAELTGS